MHRTLAALTLAIPLLLGAKDCSAGGANPPPGTIVQKYTMPQPDGRLYVLHFIDKHGDRTGWRKTLKQEPSWWDFCTPGEDTFPKCAGGAVRDIDLGA